MAQYHVVIKGGTIVDGRRMPRFERSMLSMTRNEAISLDAMRAGMPWDWESFPEFLDSGATPR